MARSQAKTQTGGRRRPSNVPRSIRARLVHGARRAFGGRLVRLRIGADLLIALIYFIAAVSSNIRVHQGVYTADFHGWLWVIPVGCMVLVFVRRVIPWWTLVGVLSLDFIDRAMDVATEQYGPAIALGTIAMERSRRQFIVACIVAGIILTLSFFIAGRSLPGTASCLFVYSLGAVIGLLLRRVSEERLRASRQLAVVRAAHAREIKAQERREISYEVHDVLTHSLAVTARLSDVALLQLRGDAAAAKSTITEIGTSARRGMTEVRAFIESMNLRGGGLRPQQSLDDLVSAVRLAGVGITLVSDGSTEDSKHTDYLILRIVQESLTNALKHARPSNIEVIVQHPTPLESGLVRVENDGVAVADPGRGGATPGGNGSGLHGLRARVVAIGGSMRWQRDHGGRWVVSAVVPPQQAVQGKARR